MTIQGLRGSVVALVTPFHADGSVNFEKIQELVNWHIDQGTDAILALGTTGESATMTHEEDDTVLRTVIETAAGRVPIIAGTGSNCTQTMVEKSQRAARLGADGLLLISPYYKEASGDMSYVMKIAHCVNENFALWSGNDDIILPVLAAGGSGVISVWANIMPKICHGMVMDYLSGNHQKALQTALRYLPIANGLFMEVNPIPVKTAMNLMGMEMGPFRLPLCEMSEPHQAALAALLQKAGLLNA